MEIMSSLPEGYNALIIGASGGIGAAIAGQIETDTRAATISRLSRTHDGFDFNDEKSMETCAANLKCRTVNLLVCATGALSINGVGPEKSIKQVSRDSMAAQFLVNAIGPALVLKYFLPLIPRTERAILAFLSARVGSIGDNRLGGWMSYRASKAALNQIVRTAAIEIARTHSQCVVTAIHPGTVATPLSEPFSSGKQVVDAETAASSILSTLNATTTARTGRFLAYDGSEIVW